MSYNTAMEAAGATIHDYQTFGSYQGDWFAKVTFEGRTFWVHGSYGSCSGCDAFEAEFDYEDGSCQDHRYDRDELKKSCEECAKAAVEYQRKRAAFGRHYLNSDMTQAEAEAYAVRNLDWDSEATEMVEYLKKNAI